jgi:uncharacterized RDD family membrane protein YckC
MADVGRRLGAYMIDAVGIGLVVGVASAGLGMVLAVVGGAEVMQTSVFVTTVRVAQVVGWLVTVAYFAVAESWWGRGLGKQLLGLRVVGADGDRAELGRTLLRSLFIPGTLGISLALSFLVSAAPTSATPGQMLAMTALTFLGYVPLLLCATTMRACNGYRGIHELVSGTRVVRQGSMVGEAAPLDVPTIAPVVLPQGPRQFGPFRAVGTLGQSGSVTVLQAQDELLQRPVWIHLGPGGAVPSGERVRLSRPTRLRWLQGGETGGQHWDAFEAVVGASLQDVLRPGGPLGWEHGRFVLLALG